MTDWFVCPSGHICASLKLWPLRRRISGLTNPYKIRSGVIIWLQGRHELGILIAFGGPSSRMSHSEAKRRKEKKIKIEIQKEETKVSTHRRRRRRRRRRRIHCTIPLPLPALENFPFQSVRQKRRHSEFGIRFESGGSLERRRAAVVRVIWKLESPASEAAKEGEFKIRFVS